MVVHILRSIYKKPELLILDAMLEKLAPHHLEKMFELLRELKDGGATILCFAHSIDDIYGLADKVTIIRNGEVENYHDFYQLLRYNEAIMRKLPINLIVTDNENKIKMINDHGKEYFKVEKLHPKTLYIDDLLQTHSGTALDLIKSAFREKTENTFYNIPITIDGNQIVSNLISFSDNRKIVNEDFELNRLIASIINLIRFNARRKRIVIDFSPSDHPIQLNANVNEIKQVILNLLKNSFEASGGGGAIQIKTSTISQNSEDQACITFRDNGIGIEDENLDNIFLPFYSTKRGSDMNLGLGLSVSYGILKKYRGNISVRNRPGSGCEFTVTLPRKS